VVTLAQRLGAFYGEQPVELRIDRYLALLHRQLRACARALPWRTFMRRLFADRTSGFRLRATISSAAHACNMIE
jgi:hypothetical protein